MNQSSLDEASIAFRRFNRFYTRKIGVLGDRLLDSPFGLTEARILFELASREKAGIPTCASELRSELGLDAGYLSRLLGRFEKKGIITSSRIEGDARRRSLRLEERGRELFGELDAASGASAAQTLSSLGDEALQELIRAMKSMERILGEGPKAPLFDLREPGPGDLGWVVSTHGEMYAREYGWGAEFEALVARIVADFAARHEGARERAWIAWAEGRRVGSVFLVKIDDETAKLRLLILAPEARGYGLGRRLVEECIAFAAAAGYSRLVLWTNNSLTAARSIYAKTGFRLISSEPETGFAPGTMSETWELDLRAPAL